MLRVQLILQESGRQLLPFAQAKFELKWGGGDGEGGLGARYVECLCVTEREGEREYYVVLKAIYSTERKGKALIFFPRTNQPRKEPPRGEGKEDIFFPANVSCLYSHESKAILFKSRRSGGIDGVVSGKQTKEGPICAPVNHVNPVDHNFGHHFERR